MSLSEAFEGVLLRFVVGFPLQNGAARQASGLTPFSLACQELQVERSSFSGDVVAGRSSGLQGGMMILIRNNRTGLIAGLAAAAFLLTGCPDNGPEGPDDCPPGQIRDEDGECVDEPRVCELWEPDCCTARHHSGDQRGDRDCSEVDAGTYSYTCDTSTGTCILLCQTGSDCAEWYPELCGDGHCNCEGGDCLPPACSSHADCAGHGLCIGGECQQAQAQPNDCVISPSPLYTKEGESVALHAYPLLNGEHVVTDAPVSWSSGNDAVASVDAGTGIATGGSEASSTTITAEFGSASCSVDVTNYTGVASGEARVLVLDEVSREPISLGMVVIDVGDDLVEADVDAMGVASFSGIPASGAIDVHVFASETVDAPNGYTYVSAIGTNERDLVFYLPRNFLPRNAESAAGIKGTLSRADFERISDKQVHLALSGLSIPGNFIDLDLEMLVGEMIEVEIDNALVEQAIGTNIIPLPSGLVFGLSGDIYKPWYAAAGVPGRRSGWMLGGNLDLGQLLEIVSHFDLEGSEIDFDAVDMGDLMGTLLPMLDDFYSAVTPGLEVSMTDLPDSAEGWPPPGFADGNLTLSSPLALKGIMNVPTLPSFGGSYMDGALLLGGVMVEGQGLVPLGIAAGVDSDDPAGANGRIFDPRNTGNAEDLPEGKLALRMAPQHGGIEGSDYTVVALALSFDGLMAEERRFPLSGVVTSFDSLGYEEEKSFPVDSFLELAENATLDVAARVYTPEAVSGANLYRATMLRGGGQNWVVYHEGSSPITLIEPPEGFADRATNYLNAQAVSTHGGLGLDELFQFNSSNLDDLVDLVSAFSSIMILRD